MTKGYRQSPESIAKRVEKLRGQVRSLEKKNKILNSHKSACGCFRCSGTAWNKGINGEKSHSFGRKLSKEAITKIIDRRSGDKSNFWKGGVTPINKRIRQSARYRRWRKAVFKRDDWTCVWCGNRGGKLNADHIKPFALFPEIRFSTCNGRTLCELCHRKTDSYGSRCLKNYS